MILLYHRNLSLGSGTGQLVQMQAEGLRGASAPVRLACQRRTWKFFLQTGWWPRRLAPASAAALALERRAFVVDHGMQTPQAPLVFVHNVVAEAEAHLPGRDDLVSHVAAERSFYDSLGRETRLVANSHLAKAALVRRFAVEPERIHVHYPGFRAERFRFEAVPALRRRARAALRVTDVAPLIGFVTSGDFHKRGLDLFLAAAERIADERPDARFLVVGSKRLPRWAQAHALASGGNLCYRPKSRRPELWMAALDVFLYAARFEEFGMVVSEAQALGVPLVTSRRVGAIECLPPEYDAWLAEEPEPDELAENTLRLLSDATAGRRLAAAARDSVARLDDVHYARATVATILGCWRAWDERPAAAQKR